MGMIDAHPSLVASLPQAPPADMWVGDDFHHNGAFRLMYTFSWLLNYDSRIKSDDKYIFESFDFGTDNGFEFFLKLGPLKNVNEKYFKYSSPTWNDYILHGDYDDYWQSRNILSHLHNITHPVLIVAGWFDAEDFYGPLNIYRTIEENCPQNQTTLIIGPWKHSGWNWMDGDRLGDIEFGETTGEFFREEIEFPFFLKHLKQEELFEYPEVLAFETGTNEWKILDYWPPQKITEKKIYLQDNEKLSFSLPINYSENSSVSYVSDPMNPIPWSTEVRTTQGHLWMIEDQRFVADREDVLVFQSEVLEEDITIAGPIIAELFVSTTGTDADWIVKLIDVFPTFKSKDNEKIEKYKLSGYQMLLAGEVFRSKYRYSFEKPEPMVPGKITEIEINLGDRLHCFEKGHRIMVQIQSSWFPVIDMNPQTFIDIYNADEDDFQKAVHTVYFSRKYPSQIQINILE
jgi:putative CocE/NonD family hydrolase